MTVRLINGQLYSPHGGRVRGPWIHPSTGAMLAASIKDEERPCA